MPPSLPALLAAARASKFEPLPEAKTAIRADLAESTPQSSPGSALGQAPCWKGPHPVADGMRSPCEDSRPSRISGNPAASKGAKR